ncbi:MAG: N-acetyl-1-D-myo-inositol-2-amino-2-deoxy-alpha-D-glucopyranoside deacetylase [Kineosporiaceae bacterium]
MSLLDDGDAVPGRLLFVHAHPDDETINNGATMAAYVAAGAQVALVTCTRGEEGEVIPAELAHLAADAEDALGPHRVHELAAAMTALGVRSHRFLGAGDPWEPGFAPREYADSGMAYGPDGSVVPTPTSRPGAFALADLDEAAARLAATLRHLRPHVVVTYEPGGGYGHPDHVRTHDVVTAAVDLAASTPGAGGPAWDVPKLYWCAVPRSQLTASFAGGPVDAGAPAPSMVMDDALVTAALDVAAWLPAKTAALRAHATQIVVKDGAFALSNDLDQVLLGTEWYRLARRRGGGGPFTAADGVETDLLADLDVSGLLA